MSNLKRRSVKTEPTMAVDTHNVVKPLARRAADAAAVDHIFSFTEGRMVPVESAEIEEDDQHMLAMLKAKHPEWFAAKPIKTVPIKKTESQRNNIVDVIDHKATTAGFKLLSFNAWINSGSKGCRFFSVRTGQESRCQRAMSAKTGEANCGVCKLHMTLIEKKLQQ